MTGWPLPGTRSRFWRLSGLGLILASVGLTAYYTTLGPRALPPAAASPGFLGTGTQGRFGTFVEQLGAGTFALSYDTIQGNQDDLQLHQVHGRLDEPLTIWGMVSPSARREKGLWTLMGPMDVDARQRDTQTQEGRGAIAAQGPALGWDHGVWTGLATLLWDDLTGNGKGRWTLPPGWQRDLDGTFKVDKGPVTWVAAESGALKDLTAQRMRATLGFKEGHLEDVSAHLDGGDIQAATVEIQEKDVRFDAPIHFRRTDGWTGTAERGVAPRPPEGKPFDQIELQTFRATRPTEGGSEVVQSLGARWTPAGLRLEGDARLEMPVEGQTAVLRAPRILQRTAPGPDLPADLPAGVTWAEPQAVLTWGERTLSSPRIEGRHAARAWTVRAPALGKGEMGTFAAGEGQGNPLKWEFQGPITARFLDGGQVRADHLTWEPEVMTLTGRPATLTRLRQRLAGIRILRRPEAITFPQGISGALAAQEGDINLRADRGRAEETLLTLDGRVDCQGQAWRLQADHISVTLGPGHTVKLMTANGSVVLKGKMGEGKGDTLDLDPARQTANWHGNVRALTELQP